MAEETIESIQISNNIEYLINLERRAQYYISLLEDRSNIKGDYKTSLIKEANDYGIKTLDEYISIKRRFYLSLREACINRIIELNAKTTRGCSASPVII